MEFSESKNTVGDLTSILIPIDESTPNPQILPFNIYSLDEVPGTGHETQTLFPRSFSEALIPP